MGPQPEEGHPGDPGGDGDQRRRNPRKKMLDPDEEQNHYEPDREGRQGRLRKPLEDGQQVVEEGALLEMDAQELRELVQNDDEADAGLEADQHRLGDEVRDEAQPQDGRQKKDASHEKGQHRRGAEE